MGIINNIMFAAPYSPAFAGVPFNAAYGAADFGYAGAAAPFYGNGFYNAAPIAAYGDNPAGFANFGAYGAAPYAGAWGNGLAYSPAAFGNYGYNTYGQWNNVLGAGGYPYAF